MNNPGFTLVEMLVVVSVIALMGLMIIPTILGMFNSGTDSQSYAMLTTELAAARTLAVRTSCYVCVHIQQADQGSDPTIPAAINGKVYMAVLVRSPLPSDPQPPNGISYFYQDQVFAIGTLLSGTTSALTANPPVGTTWLTNPWVANQWSGYWVRMISGRASGQTAQIIAGPLGNNGLQLSGSLNVTPSSGDYYMIYKPTNMDPQVLPGTIAFGRIAVPPISVTVNGITTVQPGNFVANSAFVGANLGDNSNDAGNNMLAQSFMTVNIIFAPNGSVVTTTPDGTFGAVDYGTVHLATVIPGTTNPLPGYFYDDSNAVANGIYTKLWPMPSSSAAASAVYKNVPTAVNYYDGVNQPQPGTSAVTMVDYMKFLRYTGTGGTPSNRYTYLTSDNGGCPYLTINANTGQMLPRK
jgi:prepilin-type N-terminal cleavage/methylation domain-containing protein